ncbi:MAG: DUF2442 domain-containing protein [Leptospiraceae bacterium]|nr:DUF2442 domain-containing protein [Leptospiraceae bacterium]
MKKYNIASLIEKPQFEKLKNISYLKSAKIDLGGYGISWDDCDISENELWINGEQVIDHFELERISSILDSRLI